MTDLQALVGRLCARDKARSEATIQADVRQLLLTADFGLDEADVEVNLETQVGDRRRIDIELGQTVIEVKRDLRSATVLKNAIEQLAGYLETRSDQTGVRVVGILTDGVEWRAYQIASNEIVESTQLLAEASEQGLSALLMWLEGVLATRQAIKPTPEEVAARLGARSAAHALDLVALRGLYEDNKTLPTIHLKRELWSRLLRSALGTQFTDDTDLFLQHTLLVNSAEIIAHLVVGLNVNDLQPASLLGGQRFDHAGLHGVVERDFFDWVLEVPGGEAFVRTLSRRISRFDWSNVEHDVLKVLYESIIESETRKSLGEYYTPDWLAEKMVVESVDDPLNQRVLDPACGSGTFLFHSVRRFLDSARTAGRTTKESLDSLTTHILGMDLHPVAVSLARVTYLLAVGRERLTDPTRGSITIPVYLGDSIQWRQRLDLFTDGNLVISTGTGGQLFDDELRFPESLLADAPRFDQLVTALADKASEPRDPKARPSLPSGLIHRLAISPNDLPVIEESYRTLCRLHDEGRDHIWSYYVRNLARPLWLSRQENRVDVLIGNPPWLSYRFMPGEMQEAFRGMSVDRKLWHGRESATHQDLSALFIARSIQQYLRLGGSFSFVTPNAVVDREYYAGFRSGFYPDTIEPSAVSFTGAWDLRRIRPHFFPRGSSVVFGKRVAADAAQKLAGATELWTGSIPRGKRIWAEVSEHLTMTEPTPATNRDGTGSAYGPRFAQGASIVPRVLFMVNRAEASPLGMTAGKVEVRSSRSSTEKPPWKNLPDQEGVIEAEFVKPILLGENVLPYKILPARHGILPLEHNTIIDSTHAHLDRYPGLAEWWRKAEQLWVEHRSSARLSLTEQLDFRKKLTGQLPAPSHRLVYGKAGMHVAAAVLEDSRVIVDHTLYLGTVTSRDEGLYLCAILNSPSVTALVRPLMSYGKDERHIDKHLWRLPIPRYESENEGHLNLVKLAFDCEAEVSQLDFGDTTNFVVMRRAVRNHLQVSTVGQEIDRMVVTLLAGD